MSKLYTTDGKILSDGFPEIKIKDKCFRVDTRKSTYDKIQEEVNEAGSKAEQDKILIRWALGEEATKEIEAMELTLKGYMNLLTYIHAAFFDITFEEAEARFQKAL